MLNLDKMWHTFILFTKDYTEFGIKYFNHYLHHEPNMDKRILTEVEKTKFAVKFEKYLSYVYDHSGEEVLR